MIPETDSGELFWGGTPGMIPGTDPGVSQCEPPESDLFGGGLQGQVRGVSVRVSGD